MADLVQRTDNRSAHHIKFGHSCSITVIMVVAAADGRPYRSHPRSFVESQTRDECRKLQLVVPKGINPHASGQGPPRNIEVTSYVSLASDGDTFARFSRSADVAPQGRSVNSYDYREPEEPKYTPREPKQYERGVERVKPSPPLSSRLTSSSLQASVPSRPYRHKVNSFDVIDDNIWYEGTAKREEYHPQKAEEQEDDDNSLLGGESIDIPAEIDVPIQTVSAIIASSIPNSVKRRTDVRKNSKLREAKESMRRKVIESVLDPKPNRASSDSSSGDVWSLSDESSESGSYFRISEDMNPSVKHNPSITSSIYSVAESLLMEVEEEESREIIQTREGISHVHDNPSNLHPTAISSSKSSGKVNDSRVKENRHSVRFNLPSINERSEDLDYSVRHEGLDVPQAGLTSVPACTSTKDVREAYRGYRSLGDEVSEVTGLASSVTTGPVSRGDSMDDSRVSIDDIEKYRTDSILMDGSFSESDDEYENIGEYRESADDESSLTPLVGKTTKLVSAIKDKPKYSPALEPPLPRTVIQKGLFKTRKKWRPFRQMKSKKIESVPKENPGIVIDPYYDDPQSMYDDPYARYEEEDYKYEDDSIFYDSVDGITNYRERKLMKSQLENDDSGVEEFPEGLSLFEQFEGAQQPQQEAPHNHEMVQSAAKVLHKDPQAARQVRQVDAYNQEMVQRAREEEENLRSDETALLLAIQSGNEKELQDLLAVMSSNGSDISYPRHSQDGEEQKHGTDLPAWVHDAGDETYKRANVLASTLRTAIGEIEKELMINLE